MGLVQSVGTFLQEMLLDILVYPDGPRLRDRLSHGELSFHTIPSSLVSFVTAILISLSAKLPAFKKAPGVCIPFVKYYQPQCQDNLNYTDIVTVKDTDCC